MHGYLSVAVVLIAGSLFVSGGVAVRTGRLLPWLRRRCVRPAMWGYGAMFTSAGLAAQTTYGVWDVLGGSPILETAVPLACVLLMIAGFWFQLLATRPPLDT
ncbi:hypothetical protein [Streptomyces geranii]|uniref:hypothetical protein n=1 Tax=Streptomyces geranii TaxID=2058923 RepID=UPI000D047BB1|nr:hypothetical protein [Streptomyces geranii]